LKPKGSEPAPLLPFYQLNSPYPGVRRRKKKKEEKEKTSNKKSPKAITLLKPAFSRDWGGGKKGGEKVLGKHKGFAAV